MTDEPPTSDLVLRKPEPEPGKPAGAPARPRRSPLFVVLAGVAALLAVLVVAVVGLRIGVATGPGRVAVSRLLDGLKISRFGRLHVEGLQGDLLHDFTVRRVTVVDGQGVWLEIADLAVRWDSPELLARRFHAERIRAASVRILRDPVVTAEPPQTPSPNPLTIAIDDLKLRLQSLPAVSIRPGLWDISAQAMIDRRGPAQGKVDAVSLLHKGDGLAFVFRLGDKNRLVLRADATEGEGGALAGALGLPANQRFMVHAAADGSAAEGKLTLDTKSGQTTPARLDAHWTRAGTFMDGKLVLAASTHTQRFVERMGPEAHLTLTARQSRGDLYDIDGTLVGQSASITAKGPIDWRKRNSTGLDVKLAVADLSKWWVPVPKVGPARAAGVLSGDPDHFTYKGSIAAEHLEQWDYTLARASGPATFTHKPGEWRVQAELTGEGGAGRGLLPALLGARPTASLDGARIADGRFMFRTLKVLGPGLKVNADGGQGLFGGLSFKGDMEVSNLAAARPGAHGLVTASWNAGEAKGGHLWDFTFDAKGANFASSYAELDRLLGSTPHLTGDASYGATGWTVAKADLSGGALQASARGTLDHADAMAFDVNWRAQGPFTAGPIQIDGQVSGSGKVGGRLAAPSADLEADLAAIDFGRLLIKPAHLTLQFANAADGLNGQIALSGPSDYGRASAKAGFRFLADGLALQDIDADAGGVKLSGALALRGGAPSTANLKLAMGPGALLSTGKVAGAVKIVDRPGGAVADIDLKGENISIPGVARSVAAASLKAQGPWAKLPFQISAQSDEVLDWRFTGSGELDQGADTKQVSLSAQGRVKKAELHTLEPAILRLGPDEQSFRLRLQLGGGRADIDARQVGDALDAKANLKGLALAAFDQDFIGQFDATVAIQGKGPRLTGALDAALSDARSRDAPVAQALSGRIHGVLANNQFRIDADATNSLGLRSEANLQLPANVSAAPFRLAIAGDKPMKGAFNLDGEIRPLFDLWAGGARTLSGRVVANGTIGGTLAAMNWTGQGSLTGGRLQDVATGLDLRNMEVQASVGQNSVTVDRFSGADVHGGTVTGDGRVSLTNGGASTFTLNLIRFQLIDNEIARATASGAVTVTRDADGHANLKGGLTVDRADITAKPPTPTGVVPMEVLEINRPRKAGVDGPSKPAGPQIGFNVDIKAARGVFVKGNGLSVELSLDSHVGGNTARPELTGEAHMVRGDYQFAGKRFDFDDRSTIRLGSTAQAIRLDLTATRDDPTLTAVVRIEGTAAKPEISLSSTPVLPEDEVLAQVLFGRSASQLSSLEAAQLAAALTTLATGGGFDVLGGLRQFAGLDRLALGGGVSGMGISGGKYLTDDIYLELTGGGREGPSAQVEWRIRRNLSLVSTVGTQGDSRVSVRWRKNY